MNKTPRDIVEFSAYFSFLNSVGIVIGYFHSLGG